MTANLSVTGVFLEPGHGLAFNAVTPCRLVDTRTQNGGGGPIQGGTFQSFNLPQLAQSKGCADLSTAAVVFAQRDGGAARVRWAISPSGRRARPSRLISTMNSLDGRIKANAAIVPAGTSGAVSVYVSNTTDVVLDIDGYFAPSGGSTLAVLSADAVPRAGYPQRQRPAGRPVSEERPGARLPGAVERLQHSHPAPRPTR